MFLVIMLGTTTLFGLAYAQRRLSVSRQRSALNPNESDAIIHPAIVPYKKNQEACETKYREWKNEECVARDDDHTF